jgi:hypothetical protein
LAKGYTTAEIADLIAEGVVVSHQSMSESSRRR